MGKAEHPLFDPDKARGPRDRPDVGQDVTDEIVPAAPRGPMSVSALLARVKAALTDAFARSVGVIGEISNCKYHSSGHLYFRLKDASSAIDAVMWRSDLTKLKFKPTDGLEVIATGRVDVYEVRGQLQLYVEGMTPKGAGALELAFRQMKEKLQAEGLFDPGAKKPIPRFPRAVGIVTSPTGAAIRDIARTLGRRWPAAQVFLAPAMVQGDQAAATIAEAIRLLDAAAQRLNVETIIVARGGGSMEDLWAFNDQIVARAIFAARTPIISGVGHESDITISDLVADVRAATPTAAAELAVPDSQEITQQLAQLAVRLSRRAAEYLALARTQLSGVLRSAVFRDPTGKLRTQTQLLDELSRRLGSTARDRLANQRRLLQGPVNQLSRLHPARLTERARARIDQLTNGLAWNLGARTKTAGDQLTRLAQALLGVHPTHRVRLTRQRVAAAGKQLEALSYRNVLRRGYSVTRRASGQIIRCAEQVVRGDLIRTELSDGNVSSKVTGAESDSPDKTKTRRREGDAKTGKTLFDT